MRTVGEGQKTGLEYGSKTDSLSMKSCIDTATGFPYSEKMRHQGAETLHEGHQPCILCRK